VVVVFGTTCGRVVRAVGGACILAFLGIGDILIYPSEKTNFVAMNRKCKM